MTRILVTGGAGFIGSHIAGYFINSGTDVNIINDLSTGKKENINSKSNFIEGSILDVALLKEAMKGIDCVFHNAAWPRIQRSFSDPIGTHNVNVTGTVNIIKAMADNGIRRLIFSSSSSVYGIQNGWVMNERMMPNPQSPYALQKLISEQYCSLFSKIFKLRAICLRYFNVYGPRQVNEGEYALVIGKFITLKNRGEPLTIYGDGEQTRAFTHISDVVLANALAYRFDAPIGNNVVFNIGTNKETSISEIARIIDGNVQYIEPNPLAHFEEKLTTYQFVTYRC